MGRRENRYALAKLGDAVGQLASGKGGAAERVYLVRRFLLRIDESDFPGSLGGKFSAIVTEIERRRNMKNATGAKLARRIVDLWHELAAHLRVTLP